jgi:Mrp family chromosome partitioning ATPase
MMSGGNGSGHRWWSLFGKRPEPSGFDARPYRRLALQLHYGLPRSEKLRSALLVTPEGSSVSAQSSLGLATSLADELKRSVLLVDASARSADATRILGCSGERGLAEFLAEPSLCVAALTFETTDSRVSFLPAGDTSACEGDPPSQRLSALFQAASRDYDFVLFSGGSVLAESMALALAPLVGCVLLIARENETSLDDLDAAQQALDLCQARKIGLVLTTRASGKMWVPST